MINSVISEIFKSTVTLFVILDVLGLIPIYLSFFKTTSKKSMDDCAHKTVLYSGVIMLIFLLFGSLILKFFSISIQDFKIAGGLILLIIGIKFVLGLRVLPKGNKIQTFAIVPFATPLLVGPGTLTSLIILVDAYGLIVPLIAAAINIIIIWIMLKNARNIFKVLGYQGSEVVTRIMGLLITAIAVGFIRTGWVG